MSKEWQQSKIHFLELLANRWRSENLEWAVCNGLEGYPDKVGRDLDVVTSSSDLLKMVAVTLDTMREQGFTPLPYKLGWIYWIVGIRWNEGKVESVQIDIFDHLQWGFSWVVDGVGKFGCLEDDGPFIVDPAATVGKRLVLNTLSGNFHTFEKKPHYLNLTDSERKVLPELLKSLSGGDACLEMLKAFNDGDLTGIRHEFLDFKKKVHKHALKSSSNRIKRYKTAFQKQWQINLFPKRAVPIIAVQSEDELLEKEVCDHLSIRFNEELVFCASEFMEIRPKKFFRGEVNACKVLLDYILGDRLRLRRLSALQCLQCFRGHVLALKVNPSRAGIKSFPGWMLKLVPKVDLNFIVSNHDEENALSRLSDHVDSDIIINHEPVAIADEVFEKLISYIESNSEAQHRELGLEWKP